MELSFTERDALEEQVWKVKLGILFWPSEAWDVCLLDIQVEMITQLTLQVWNSGERHTD